MKIHKKIFYGDSVGKMSGSVCGIDFANWKETEKRLAWKRVTCKTCLKMKGKTSPSKEK